jgi:hypothetical protein
MNLHPKALIDKFFSSPVHLSEMQYREFLCNVEIAPLLHVPHAFRYQEWIMRFHPMGKTTQLQSVTLIAEQEPLPFD